MKTRMPEIVQHEGNLDTADSEFYLDTTSLPHLMEMLANPYSDNLQAILREYSTNGRDSHVAAGNTAPIEITLPRELIPNFVVRDYGEGMSHDDLRKNFIGFGSSTKRDTNEQIGSLGIGCKSGLNVATSFTVVAVKNGVMVQALITKNEQGIGTMKVFDTSATDEPNGVEISIPIPSEDIRSFRSKAYDFFRFWEPGTVLVDGEEVESIFTKGLMLEEGFMVVNGEGLNSHYIVMGNVPYPMPAGTKIPYITGTSHVVVQVPIGAVDFTISRESLKMTPWTEEVIEDIKNFTETHFLRHIQSVIDACPTHLDALQTIQKWRNSSRSKLLQITYKGEKIPEYIEMTGQDWTVGYVTTRAQKVTYITTEALSDPQEVVIITGHPARSMVSDTKQAIKVKYPKANRAFVVHRFGSGMKKWVEGVPTVTFEDLCPKIPKAPTVRAPRQKKKWEVYDPATKTFKEMYDIPPGLPIVYLMRRDGYASLDIPVHRWKSRYDRPWNTDDYRKHLTEFIFITLKMNVNVVLVGLPDKDKFKKLYPGAKNVSEFFQQVMDHSSAGLSADSLAWSGSHVLQGVNPNEVLDPEVRKLIGRIKAVVDPVTIMKQQRRKLVADNYRRYTKPDFMLTDTKATKAKTDFPTMLENWARNYPLITRHDTITAHRLDYINALYLYRKRKAKAQS